MESVVTAFSQISRVIERKRGAVLFTGPLTPDHVYYVEQGYVKICRDNIRHGEAIFAFIGPGAVCGDNVHRRGLPFDYTAQMLTNGLVREIPRDAFDQFCKMEPEAWKWLAELEARRRSRLERRIEIMCIADAKSRLMALIPFLVNQYRFPRQADGAYELPLKQCEFASLIGSTRETTSSMLNQLERSGLLKLHRGKVRVPELDAFLENGADNGDTRAQSAFAHL